MLNLTDFLIQEAKREHARRAVKLTDINEEIDKLVKNRKNTYFKTKKFKQLERKRLSLI